MNYYAWEKIRAIESERRPRHLLRTPRGRLSRSARRQYRRIERGWPPILNGLRVLLEARARE
jgi:hypothetical protein